MQVRYADRVKELKAGSRKKAGAILFKPVDIDAPMASSPVPEDGYDSLEATAKEDMALVLSERGDVLEYHDAINKVVDLEDEIVEEHKKVLAKEEKWAREEKTLMASIDDPETDTADYANALDAILKEKIEEYTMIRQNLVKFKEVLKAEEILGLKVKNSPSGKNTFV
jgi:hypothetical protein